MNHNTTTQQKYQDILQKFFSKEQVWEYSLVKIKAACKAFWNPQTACKVIHIAGTNGKGSVSKMIFQILKDAGKKVWVYTSPHLIDIRERFETQTGLISQEDFLYYASQVLSYGHDLWYFERCVLLAFLYFRDQSCQYAIIEVGMWGRLDATNIVSPIVSLITNIGYDHMEYLWNTLEEVSYEKAGIIKTGIPTILYEENKVIEKIAKHRDSQIIFPSVKDIETNLLWTHQIKNATLAYEIWKYLWFPDAQIRESLHRVQHRGRLDFIQKNILMDGAHNESWLRSFYDFIQTEKNNWEDIVYCIAIKRGKIPDTILSVFPENDTWTIIDSDNNLLESPDVLQEHIVKTWIHAEIRWVQDIYSDAKHHRKTLYVVFGSLYVLQEFMGE